MKPLSSDPIINAINNGVRRSINITIENRCFRAAVILIFAGIDAMGHLNRPATQKSNSAKNFKEWVDKYFHIQGQTKITSEEWWAARNAIVHTYGAISQKHRSGSNVRILGWMVDSKPHIRFDSIQAPHLVLVDILAMREAFLKGMDKFLIDAFSDSTRKQLIEERINQLVLEFPVKEESKNEK